MATNGESKEDSLHPRAGRNGQGMVCQQAVRRTQLLALFLRLDPQQFVAQVAVMERDVERPRHQPLGHGHEHHFARHMAHGPVTTNPRPRRGAPWPCSPKPSQVATRLRSATPAMAAVLSGTGERNVSMQNFSGQGYLRRSNRVFSDVLASFAPPSQGSWLRVWGESTLW